MEAKLEDDNTVTLTRSNGLVIIASMTTEEVKDLYCKLAGITHLIVLREGVAERKALHLKRDKFLMELDDHGSPVRAAQAAGLSKEELMGLVNHDPKFRRVLKERGSIS